MASSIYGVEYANVAGVCQPGNLQMTLPVDQGSFGDDGNTPPTYYTFTMMDGSQQFNISPSAIVGVTPVTQQSNGS